MSAEDGHSSQQGAISEGIENAGGDITDDIHSGGVDEKTTLLRNELNALEIIQELDDTDSSNASTAGLPDELPESSESDHPSHIGVLPLQEDEGHLREVLTVPDSPENTSTPSENPGTATGEKNFKCYSLL